MLGGFANASKFPAEMLNGLMRSESFSLESLQTNIDLFMSTFPGEKVLRDEKNGKLWSSFESNGVESLDKHGMHAQTARHSSRKELLLE